MHSGSGGSYFPLVNIMVSPLPGIFVWFLKQIQGIRMCQWSHFCFGNWIKEGAPTREGHYPEEKNCCVLWQSSPLSTLEQLSQGCFDFWLKHACLLVMRLPSTPTNVLVGFLCSSLTDPFPCQIQYTMIHGQILASNRKRSGGETGVGRHFQE